MQCTSVDEYTLTRSLCESKIMKAHFSGLFKIFQFFVVVLLNVIVIYFSPVNLKISLISLT